jgi:hypothetical protein
LASPASWTDGVALIAVLTPFALVAGTLDGMARFPILAAAGVLVACFIAASRGDLP